MGVNYSLLIYGPAFDQFARPIIVTPTVSQGSNAGFANRGIYHSDVTSYLAENNTIISDQTTTLDIRDDEFPVTPAQGDFVSIPQDGIGGMKAVGDFLIVNVWNNGGGEITLQLRRVEPGTSQYRG